MSQLKTKFNSAFLKAKFNDLLESIDRNNTSRMIVERYYSKLSSLEISEGVYSELVGIGVDQNNAQHLTHNLNLSESNTTVADSYSLNRIQILESAIKELKAYSWMPSVKSFITECQNFINENQTYILIESVIRDLELNRNSKSFANAIEKLREASHSKNPDSAIIENLQSEIWIPLVKKLYEWSKNQQGTITGKNPKFQVSKIYSPVEAIDENKFMFHSNGLILELVDNKITKSNTAVPEDFKHLIKITESAKFGENVMRINPSPNSVLDISFGNDTKISLNGKVHESKNIETALIASGFVRFNETDKLGMVQRAIHEGSKIKEIDFGYRVKSSIFEGLSVSVFNLNDRIFIQKTNHGMKENTIIEANSASDAVDIVKDFMNYDISESVASLLDDERERSERLNMELNKVESQIKFIIEKLAQIEEAERHLGDSEHIAQAKSLLESELKIKNEERSRIQAFIVEASNDPNGYDPAKTPLSVTGTKPISSVNDLVPGKDYTIEGKPNYAFQGYSDGEFIFNQKDETSPTPIHMSRREIELMISNGKIAK